MAEQLKDCLLNHLASLWDQRPHLRWPGSALMLVCTEASAWVPVLKGHEVRGEMGRLREAACAGSSATQTEGGVGGFPCTLAAGAGVAGELKHCGVRGQAMSDRHGGGCGATFSV